MEGENTAPEQLQGPSIEQLQEVMSRDINMIRLRASVLELKAIKFKLIMEMLDAKHNDQLVVNNTDTIARVREEVTGLLNSTMDITA